MTAELEQLLFAQHYPFSSQAKKVIAKSDFRLEEVPEEVINRAALMIKYSWEKKPYRIELKSEELLEYEILAFPVAKILLSFLNDAMMNERFCQMVSENAFHYLELEKAKGQTAMELARDFGLQFSPAEKQDFFASMKMTDFLKASFSVDALKLVNQPVDSGKIFLRENSLTMFVSRLVFAQLLSSLPVDLKGIPPYYRKAASQIRMQLKSRDFKNIELKISGKINPENFAPCIKDMYARLLSGENIPHMARFDLATFLLAIGMPLEQVDLLFSKAPNYSQKTTLYHLNRLAKQSLSPPSCKKVREHGFCPLKNCNEKHPLAFYRRKLFPKKQREEENEAK